MLRVATPLIFGTLGVLLCERAGVLHLGIEGLMVAGAFAGWYAVYHGLPLWGGVLAAAAVAAAFGLLHALLTVGLALSQHVAGLGITMLATALSYFAYRVSFPKVSTPPTVQPFTPMDWLPLPILQQQTPLTLLALCSCCSWPMASIGRRPVSPCGWPARARRRSRARAYRWRGCDPRRSSSARR